VVVCFNAGVLTVPDIDFLVVHPPVAAHDVALLENHLMVDVPPYLMADGVAVMVTAGAVSAEAIVDKKTTVARNIN
jgi:hypothetical protein